MADLPAEPEQSLVRFVKSGFEQRWDRGGSSLLQLAEDHGLEPEYGCRSGSCGTCAVKVTSGRVHYRSPPTAAVTEDEALMCCAVPSTDRLELDL